jgi:hypothetical protein
VHDPSNVASARVAEAAGLADEGWSCVGIDGIDDASGDSVSREGGAPSA